jgi:histidinol-phosphatase (PHP family)
MAAESGLFDTLAHHDLVKNELPESWNPETIAPIIRASLDRIAATGVAMELNTSGLNKRLPEMNPGPWMLAEMQARAIPVVIGADAHRPERVADQYPQALRMLQDAGYRQVSFFLDRQRQDVSIDLALASLQRDVVAV